MNEHSWPATDTSVHRPDARIAYRVEGPTEAQLLVAGHEPTASRERDDEWGVFDWSAVVEAGGRLLRYDTRGHGASTGRAVQADFGWRSLADDLVALVEAVSPQRPVDSLAVASGCGTLLWAAAVAPHRFRRLVLVLPPPMGAARERQAELLRAAAQLAQVRGAEGWARGAAAMPTPPVLVGSGSTRNPVPAVPSQLLHHVVSADADSALPDEAQLRALPHRTLILTWRDDPSHPADAAERLAALLPDAVAEIAQNVGDVRGWGPRVARFLSAR